MTLIMIIGFVIIVTLLSIAINKNIKTQSLLKIEPKVVLNENEVLNAVTYLPDYTILVLTKNKDVQLVFPDYYEVNEKGNILHTIRRHDFDKVKLFDQSAHGACTLFRTKTLILNGGYDENFTRQDGLDIWLRYYKKYKVMNLNIPLFYY